MENPSGGQPAEIPHFPFDWEKIIAKTACFI